MNIEHSWSYICSTLEVIIDIAVSYWGNSYFPNRNQKPEDIDGSNILHISVILLSQASWWEHSMRKFNTLRPRQNGRHFADDTFKRIFLNENVRISIKISLKFVPKCPINNIPALVQIMAWRRPGDKPLSEPMMISLPTHICVTRPQWVNHYQLLVPWAMKIDFKCAIFKCIVVITFMRMLSANE